MAKGDTKTEALLDILANGTKADVPADSCCNTKTQNYIIGAINRMSDIEEEIEELKNGQDVTDIVATYADLQAYDKSTLEDKDIIKVLADETHDGDSTYYRYVAGTDSFTYIGKAQSIEDFTGTDGTASGKSGLVPAPAPADAGKFLNADGSWEEVQSGGMAGYNAAWVISEETAAQSDINALLAALNNNDRVYIAADGATLDCVKSEVGDNDITLAFLWPSSEPHSQDDSSVYTQLIEAVINTSTRAVVTQFLEYDTYNFVNKNSLPVASANSLGCIKVGSGLSIADGVLSATGGGGGSSLPIVNVKSFGATGDGSTDDTRSIQNAADSISTGGTLFFPKGVYMLSTALFEPNNSGVSHAIEIYSNQRWIFEEGATLKRGAAAVNHMLFTHNESSATGYTGAENIEIIGATIDGNRGTYNTSQTPFNLSHSTNVRIIDCIFQGVGSGWHSMEINSSLDTVVDGCIFKDSSNTEDIQLDAAIGAGNLGQSDGTVCKDTIIKNCVFDMASGVAIGNHSNAAHTNTQIHNNIFKGTPNTSRGYISFVSNHKCVDVYENVFYGGAYGVNLAHSVKDSTVHDNRFENTTTPYTGTAVIKWTNLVNNVLESGDVAPQSNLAFVENDLTSVTNSNDQWILKVGDSYAGTLAPSQAGYTMGTVTISMSGTDITSTAYNDQTGVITIASVTGDIVITAFAYDDNYVTVTNTLTDVDNSNTAAMTLKNEAYTGTLTPVYADYIMGTVTVTMGGTDITSTAYNASTGVISIASVTNDIVITATATEDFTLPSGYTRLKALQTSGTQYTMTDYVVKTTTDIRISDFATAADSAVNYQTFLGSATADNASNSYEFRVYRKTTQLNFNRGNNYDLFEHGPSVTSANLIRLYDTVLTVDGTSYDVKTYFPNAKANNGTLPIQLFGRNLNGTHERISTFAQLGVIKIFEGNTLVKKYIPALDDENEPCFYEYVNGVTLKNLGTGTFGTVALQS